MLSAAHHLVASQLVPPAPADVPGGGPLHPTGRIELHLRERRSRMVGADGWIHDVRVAVRGAGAYRFGIGLRVAHRHAEPECWMQLEVERFPSRQRCSWRWILGKGELPTILVTRTGYIGIEEVRGLVVSNVVTEDRIGV